MLSHATMIVGARTQYVVKVDFEDYDFLMQWPWTYAVGVGCGTEGAGAVQNTLFASKG